jgi:hypothetical protein
MAAADVSSSHFNGTYSSCVQLGQPGALANYAGTSASFGHTPSTGCWMTYRRAAAYAGSYTAEAWVKPSSTTQSGQDFIDTRSLNGEFSFDMKLQGTSSPSGTEAVAIDVGDGSTWLTTTNFPYAYKANQWYFIAMTVTPAGATVYVNGGLLNSVAFPSNQKATQSQPQPLLWDPNHPLCVGGDARYPTGENFNGAIQDVAIFTHALSAAQIAQQYTDGTT